MGKIKIIFVFIFAFVMATIVAFSSFGLVFASEQALELNSKSAILIEADTGKVLFEKNSKDKLPIASVTKQMTILLTLEQIKSGKLDLDKLLTASKNASSMGGSQVFIDANAQYTTKNLLKAAIVASANDACVVLAEEIAGSEEAFVAQMNKRAQELGLLSTNYANCTGLPAPSHYSSAEDVAKIMQQLINYPLYFELSGVWMDDFQHPSGRVTQMANTNKLIRFYEGCDAGKTGSTHEAGFCLCATAKKGDTRLISVVLGAENSKLRFSDAKKLFDYGFNGFEKKIIVDKNTNYAKETTLEKAKDQSFVIMPSKDFSIVVKKSSTTNYTTKTLLPKKLFAPLKQGEQVGSIQVFENEKLIETVPLIIASDVKANSVFGTVKEILNKW